MRVLTAHGQEFIRRGLRMSFAKRNMLRFAPKPLTAVMHSPNRWFRPAIVIMDIIVPRMDRIEAARLVGKARPQTKILSLNQYDSPEMANEIEQAGAAAFVSKLLVSDKLGRVHSVETFFPKEAGVRAPPLPWHSTFRIKVGEYEFRPET
jgi:DNA-binding NarL/FixJ family response regulator